MSDIDDIPVLDGEEMQAQEAIDSKPLTFKEKWEQDRIQKRAKKKAKKALVDKGYDPAIAANLVKTATKKVVSNKPVKKSAGRGR